MKLQLALDVLSVAEAQSILAEVVDYIDIIEIGTPLIKKEGMRAVTEIKQQYPRHEVLADLKTIDAGALEARIAFDAGADLVTVLGLASDATIKAVIDQARRYERQVIVDLIAVPYVARRVRQIEDLEADYVCVHTGLDMQRQGYTPYTEVELLHNLSLEKLKLAVAGGVRPANLPQILSFQPGIIVVGSYITSHAHKKQAALEIRQLLEKAPKKSLGERVGELFGKYFTKKE